MAKTHVLIQPEPIQSVRFTVPSGVTVEAFQPYYINGVHGMVMQDASENEECSLDISSRTWQMNIGGLTGTVGTKLYINITTRALTNTNTDRLFGIVVKAKDSNNVADVLIYPNVA